MRYAVGLLSLLLFSLPFFAQHSKLADADLQIGSMMSAKPHVSYVGLPGSGIHLLPATSPEFIAALKSAADPESIFSIQSILPYSVMVKNFTEERLLMVTVRLYLTEPSGKRVWHDVTHGTRKNYPTDMIAPGSLVLITPEGGLNTVLSGSNSMHIPEKKMLSLSLTQLLDQYSRQSEVDITLDSVVFEDGGVIGPDKSGNMQAVNAWIAAEENVITEVLSRHGEEVNAFLASVRDTPAPFGGSLDKTDEFADHRRTYADDLISQRQAFRSEEEFFNFLRSSLASRIPALKRRQP
jgi:hypothetical protein